LIPYPIAALKDVTVLVTRPAAQAATLCDLIKVQGGEAIAFPAIVIEPAATSATQQAYDWLIFTSANAVRHGLSLVTRSAATRIAAIGKATAAALAEVDIRVDAMPQGNASSETLLAHPAFANVQTQSVLIVKGEGGRELLYDELTLRGARVATLEVYRRAQPKVDAALVAQVEQRWRADVDSAGISIVTLTSIETLTNLFALLTQTGRELLKTTPFVTPSQRIADAAREKSLQGQCVLSRGADDDALIGAIAAWHARAR
jgi:uroporphyrinogen-III synthase